MDAYNYSYLKHKKTSSKYNSYGLIVLRLFKEVRKKEYFLKRKFNFVDVEIYNYLDNKYKKMMWIPPSKRKQCDKLNIEYGVYNKNSEPLKHSLWKLNFQALIVERKFSYGIITILRGKYYDLKPKQKQEFIYLKNSPFNRLNEKQRIKLFYLDNLNKKAAKRRLQSLKECMYESTCDELEKLKNNCKYFNLYNICYHKKYNYRKYDIKRKIFNENKNEIIEVVNTINKNKCACFNFEFPKGKSRRNESFKEAAIRETKEESGICCDSYIDVSNYIHNFDSLEEKILINHQGFKKLYKNKYYVMMVTNKRLLYEKKFSNFDLNKETLSAQWSNYWELLRYFKNEDSKLVLTGMLVQLIEEIFKKIKKCEYFLNV